MTRALQFVLFSAWLVGAVTGGLITQPERPSATADVRVVAATDWARLTVRGERVVLTVGQGERPWQAAAPLPPVLTNWLRDPDDSTPNARRASLRRISGTSRGCD